MKSALEALMDFRTYLESSSPDETGKSKATNRRIVFMATKRTPTIPRKRGIELLQRQVRSGNKLLAEERLNRNQFHSWQHTTKRYLIQAFGENTANVNDFDIEPTYCSTTDTDWEQEERNDLKNQVGRVKSYIGHLRTDLKDSPADPPLAALRHSASRKIFVVHGHDKIVTQKCARYLERFGLQPIILDEQPSGGRTIIEKFEAHSDVGFAVVLLTADDRGTAKASAPGDLKSRARQNVILELGFFLGRLGRQRVCALYENGVEIPSDYHGVVYIPLDKEEAWCLKLGKELQAAGIKVDLNKTL